MLSASLNKTFPSLWVLPAYQLRHVYHSTRKEMICFVLFFVFSKIIPWHNFYVSFLHSSEVERSLMVRCVIGSILHGVDPLSYFSFQPVLHNWCNKGCGMCYPVCGMVHIKEPLLLIDKSSLCGGSRFPFSLSEWSLTICLMPYNRR